MNKWIAAADHVENFPEHTANRLKNDSYKANELTNGSEPDHTHGKKNTSRRVGHISR